MNIAVIFAGGTGQRMNSVSLPKQFLIVHGKPILVHTVSKFQECDQIDKIVIVSLKDYIDYVYDLAKKFDLSKVVSVVAGGTTGQESIYNGLVEAKKFATGNKDIVLVHDGVRPIIDSETIIKNINCVKENGNSITIAKSQETVLIIENDNVQAVEDRSKCFMGRAPQCFYLDDLYNAHLEAKKINKNDFIDSAMLMKHFGHILHTVLGPSNNIKVTTPLDYFMFKAMLDAKESEQIKVV